MKSYHSLLPLVIAMASVTLVTGCRTTPAKSAAPAAAAVGAKKSPGKPDGKMVSGRTDDLDEYDTATIPDPIEPVNRATFWFNHQLYTYLFRPISRGYETVIPKPVRRGVYNVFENARFPVRFVNDTLQGNFKRAGQETGKFIVDSVVGFGGFGRPSERLPAIADVPAGDTGQTFAKWGIKSGPYFVIPILGPSSARDFVGQAGDYALNPVNWVTIFYGGYTWTMAIPSANALRNTPPQLSQYDAATKNSLDRYLAARSAFVQYRAEVALK